MRPAGDRTRRARLWAAARTLARWTGRLPAWAILAFFRGWQLFVSPLYGQTCRFYPSCSAYALEAVDSWGVVRGGWLAGRRLLRCHPWNSGGVDPVPIRTPCPDGHGVQQSVSAGSRAVAAEQARSR